MYLFQSATYEQNCDLFECTADSEGTETDVWSGWFFFMNVDEWCVVIRPADTF